MLQHAADDKKTMVETEIGRDVESNTSPGVVKQVFVLNVALRTMQIKDASNVNVAQFSGGY